ncbi:hypothetical protein C9374_000680 [Naegleria lovaniensis]|uniref:Uncharacterized protein n=1 Tax=Naegleria lovaniensis TaxID=51637 RepID=A0AA88GU88_NAELO|nr:uncharacterized protein C9374_000680 [Naegleria lovaniensis]KAG2388516.1 hypothetical protein C9374_000680 [Naegleria lovaniensis]
MIISSFVGSSFIATKLFSGEESWPYHVHSPVDTTHEAHFIKNICGEDQYVHSSSSHHHHHEDQHEQIDYYLHVKIHGYGSLDGDLSELEQVMGLPIASIDIHRLYISTSSFYPLTEMEMALIPYNAHVLLYSSSKLEKEVQLHIGSIEQVKPLLKNKQLHVYLPYSFVTEQQWHDKARRQFIYRIDSQEEKNMITHSCEYLDLEKYSKLLRVLSIHDDESMNVERWAGQSWSFFLPSYCFEKGIIEKSFCESYDP